MHDPQKNVYDVHEVSYLAVCQFRVNTLLRQANGGVQI